MHLPNLGRPLAVSLLPLLLLVAACGGAAPPAPPSGGGTPKVQVEPSVQKVYDEFVAKEMPGVPVELLQAAKAEGTLTFYHLAIVAWPKSVQEFNRIFAGVVQVTPLQLTGGQLVERFRSEEAAGTHIADVWQNSDSPAAEELVASGLALEYKVTSSARYPATAKREGFWYPVYGTTIMSGWNTKKVTPEEAKVLETWEGLQRADIWSKHKVGFVDPAAGAGTSMPLYHFDKTYGPDWWKKLAQYPKNVYNSINPASDALAAGEIEVVLYGTDTAIGNKLASGAPVQWVYPKPSIILAGAQLVSKKAPHPNAAKLFQEFLLSRYGQSFVNQNGLYTYHADVKDARPFTKEAWYRAPGEPVAIDSDAYIKRLAPMVKEWQAAFKK